MMQRREILFKNNNSIFLNLTQIELVKKLNKVYSLFKLILFVCCLLTIYF